MKIKYVIIQAGGKGTRLEGLTKNKPKALVSVSGKPMIFHLMEKMPKAHFIIIGDYQYDVFEKYLKKFSPFKYTLIRATGEKTCSGIKDALSLVPEKTPFLLAWCDLYFQKNIFPEELQIKEHNHLGLSKDFSCRWSYGKGELKEEKSDTRGVAGIFLFKNKDEIKSVPKSGEFCKFLKETNVSFKPFFLRDAKEVGTADAYRALADSRANTRPFNSIVFKNGWAIKTPLNGQGRALAKDEVAWYRKINEKKFDFIPETRSFAPLVLKKIPGGSLCCISLSAADKQRILAEIIKNARMLHGAFGEKKLPAYQNNKEAIVGKTKKRLQSVSEIIPFIHDDFLHINGKKCINFYKRWDLVEKMCEPHLYAETYRFIHGDLTFSNILYDKKKGKAYFIDPRGYYGTTKLYGDPDYDWAKLYYSIAGNYDQFNLKKFSLAFSGEKITLTIPSNEYEKLESFFFQASGCQKEKIKLFHAIIWLSLASYAWDDYDSLCGAFYNGIRLMQNCYEKTFLSTD